MRESRANLIIALSVAGIACSMAVYSSILLSWLRRSSAIASAPKTAPAAPELTRARQQFRDHFFDARSALILSEALYKAGRSVDAFELEYWARSFYGPSAFASAHDAVVLHREDFLEGAPYEATAAQEATLVARTQKAPNSPAAWAYLGRLLADRRDPTAMRVIDNGLASNPGDRALLWLKTELLLAENPADGIASAARLANDVQGTYEARQALRALGALASQKEDGPNADASRTAHEALDELRQARPDDAEIFSTLALALAARGDVAAAHAMVAEALARRPRHPGALMVDGTLAWKRGDTDAALKRFSTAFEANPEDAVSAARLAEVFDKQGVSREAALPYDIVVYRDQPDASVNGKPVEDSILEILEARRRPLLDRAGAEALGRLFASDDASLRSGACDRAAELQDLRWIDTLRDLLDDDVELVRAAAARALAALGRSSPDALVVRRQRWLADPRPLARAGAIAVYAELDPSDAFPFVLKALEDSHPAVRFAAKTRALDREYPGDVRARRALSEYLRDETNAEVLARYGMSERKR